MEPTGFSTLSPSMTELARKLGELKQKKAVLEAELSLMGGEETLLKESLRKEMEENDTTKFSLTPYGTFYLQSEFFPKIIGDKDVLITWLDQNANGVDMAPRTVNMPRLREFIQGQMQEDRPLPPANLVECATRVGVRLRSK